MGSEETPALSRLTGFVRAVAELLPDATNAAMVEDGDEAAKIRELVAEHFGGAVADHKDAAVALVDALDVLEGRIEPNAVDVLRLQEGKIGALICRLVADNRRASITLHQIYARAKNLGGTPSEPLPANIRPVDVLVEVDEAIIRAAGWSGQRGVA